MKKKLVTLIAVPFFLLALTTSGMCLGLGFYFSGTGGKTLLSGEINVDHADATSGFGLLLDTCVAKDKVFNFRVMLGSERFNSSLKIGNYSRTDILTTFGFGIVRKDKVRFWFGPQIGIRTYNENGKLSKYGLVLYEYIFFTSDIIATNAKYELSTVGVVGGLHLGLNIHLGRVLSLSIDGGARYDFGRGTLKSDGLIFDAEGTIRTRRYEGFVNVAFIFRIRDTYSAKIL